MNTMLMLVRREFWEHRSLWIAPLVWAGIIIVLSAWAFFVIIPRHAPEGILNATNVEEIQGLSDTDREEVRKAIETANAHAAPKATKATISFSFLGISQLISAFVCIVVFFYLIDCLFTERRDRSILFWKSLPLSDTQVVLSKLAVALVVVPIGVVLLAAVTQFVLFSMFWLRFNGTPLGNVLADWNLMAWFQALVVELAILLCGVMWYAPIAAYFLLLSVWARKLVFLWAIVPLAALPALEGVFFQSTNVAEFIGRRFVGFVEAMHLDERAFNIGSHDAGGPHIGDILSRVDVSGVLLSAEAWLGLVAAAVMVYATIRIRRYRDDS
jgi:ABC-2 type transport system permease protein